MTLPQVATNAMFVRIQCAVSPSLSSSSIETAEYRVKISMRILSMFCVSAVCYSNLNASASKDMKADQIRTTKLIYELTLLKPLCVLRLLEKLFPNAV